MKIGSRVKFANKVLKTETGCTVCDNALVFLKD